MNLYNVGNMVRVSVTFTYHDGTPVDPDAVVCQVRDPTGEVTAYTYGVDAEVMRADPGKYWLDVYANVEGRWYYRWYATGAGGSAGEDVFYVMDSPFDSVPQPQPPELA